MPGAAAHAVDSRGAAPASPAPVAATAAAGGCEAVRKAGPVTMDHVLLALHETEEERDARIRDMFAFFDVDGRGQLDYAQIEAGLAALQVPAECKYARELLRACDRDLDGRVGYDDFRRYMDDKELELYRIFQAIDVEHNGCILPEELWDALVKAGIEIGDEELARFVEHVDKDNNGIITFEEWRDFLLLYPNEVTIENIYHHWERVCLVDIGEQAVIPEGISVGGKVPSLGALSRDIWVHEGPRAFYRGLVPSLLGIVPYAGIDLAVYETLKDVSKTYILKDSDPGPLVQLGCGTISGALGATCVYPLQVIRTRLQAQQANSESAYKGMSDVFWRTLQHEGVSGFYKGILPNLLKVVPAASITYLVYEAMKKNLSLD
ncbi:hypothetical protein GUJ93_ZPchr0012g19747 [Zizania palustris]|uniref:EF-hand domain-containing protein n=1 Tax=Zizania palustris TaxID=103762 RepID=A0A8J6BSD2_ZIZPA|nr:hypothetical protein GUJ93_ZPchr0012g19747 [Zizania palustris]